ncbi:MAG: ferritin [Desulfurococcaceae archaeon]
MHEELREALNKQLNQELRNAYLYLVMASYFDAHSLSGFAHYFKVQAKEELGHAMKIYEYLVDRNVPLEFYEIPPPSKKWNSIVDVVRDFYEAEKANTQRIWGLVDLAKKHNDKSVENFLQWFINEQLEEEKQASDLLAKMELVGENPVAILLLDKLLAERK